MFRLLDLSSHLISSQKYDQKQLNSILFGKDYAGRLQAFQIIQNNSQLQDHFHLNNYSRQQIRKKTIQKSFVVARSYKMYPQIAKGDLTMINYMTSYSNGLTFADMNFCIRSGVHSFLYMRSIMQLGSEKTYPLFLQAVQFKDIGCFGLTQLFHGSNVRGILTQAHYDHANQQFVLHTPSKEGMKFWIGAAGQVANMAVIWAQLYIGLKCYGVHAYVVPIRDKKTHKLLPGVIIGDCGPKGGLQGVDNGFIIFDRVRIPKDYQLNRISGVDQNGNFKSMIQNDEKRFGLHLSALSGGRFFIGTNCSALSLQALTIAIRYANERRQFKGKKDPEQKRLIQYPLMKKRLMTLLATDIVYYRTSMYYIQLNNDNIQNFLDLKNPIVEELHAISSILKAKTSWFASECIKECRQAMGGHGYSTYSKIGSLYNDNDINLTWQGDNHVLIQQTSKYVLEQAQQVIQKGKQSHNPLLKFLSNPPSQLFQVNKESLLCLKKAQQFFQYKLMQKIQDTGMRMMQLKNKKMAIMQIWNNSQVFLGRQVAIIYGDIATLSCMQQAIKLAKNQSNKQFLQLSTKLWLLSIYRKDQFIDMAHHPLIQELLKQKCNLLQKVSLQILKIISPSDKITGSPFSDENGHGIQKYLGLIMKHARNKRPQWWDILLQR